MLRRTLLRSFATGVLAAPFRRLRLFAQAPPLASADIAMLDAIAEVVLPGEIGADGRKRAVAAFVAWVRNYREGADMGHGYGSSTLRVRSGPSPAARYPAQFAALDEAARARGGRSLATLAIDERRAVIEAALNGPQPVTRLPTSPTGANVIADLMGSYFTGADAWDLCYRADIGRDRCRALEGSDRPPAPWGRR